MWTSRARSAPAPRSGTFRHVMKNCRIGERCNIGQNVVISPRCRHRQQRQDSEQRVRLHGLHPRRRRLLRAVDGVHERHQPAQPRRRGATNTRPTLVRRGASIGANSTIVCGITIGRYAFIGAGAVVTRDVPDYALIYGNPAKQRGWMCACGIKLPFRQRHACWRRCAARSAARRIPARRIGRGPDVTT